jgi:hypothetical protein
MLKSQQIFLDGSYLLSQLAGCRRVKLIVPANFLKGYCEDIRVVTVDFGQIPPPISGGDCSFKNRLTNLIFGRSYTWF